MNIKKLLKQLFAVTMLAALVLSACGPAGTTVAPTEPPQPTNTPLPPPTNTAVPPTATPDAAATAMAEIGTAAHPIKVLFVPSVDANVITTGGQVMADALRAGPGPG